MTRLAIGVAAVCVSGVALAQPAGLSESARRLIGSWEFSNADRDRICTATFKSDPAPGGFKIEFDANCANLFPLVREIAAWKFPENDLLYLLDARGRTLVEFSEVEDSIFEAPTPGVGVLSLQIAAAAWVAAGAPDQVAGDGHEVRTRSSRLVPRRLDDRAEACPPSLCPDSGNDKGQRRIRRYSQARLRAGYCPSQFRAMAHRPRPDHAGPVTR